jgi:hypothetical protein
MARTQIRLTEDQSRRLKRVSARRCVSVVEIIRRAADAVLTEENDRSPDELYDRALNTAGRFRSGRRDVSIRHDDYLRGINPR